MQVIHDTVGGQIIMTKFTVKISIPNHWWNFMFVIYGEDTKGHRRIVKYIKIMPHFICKFLATRWG